MNKTSHYRLSRRHKDFLLHHLFDSPLKLLSVLGLWCFYSGQQLEELVLLYHQFQYFSKLSDDTLAHLQVKAPIMSEKFPVKNTDLY